MFKSVWSALRSGHWPSLVGAWLHFEVSFMVWLLIGALSVSIAEEFGLSATQKGLLVAVPLLGGAILRIVVGMLSDRVPHKPIGLALLGGVLAAVLWGWLGGTTYPQMLGVGLLLGMAGASFAVALPLASRSYPPVHQGLALGVAASANSGTVLAVFFAPRLAQHVGWHGVFGLMAVPILLTAALFAWLVRGDGLSRQEGGLGWRRALAEALGRRSMYWLSFVYAVTFGGFVGFVSATPIFYHDQYDLDLVAAGSVAALCGLAGSLARPFGGYLADRLGGLRLLLVLLPVVAGLAVGVGQLPSVAWSILFMTLAVATMGFGNGVVFQVVSDRFPKQIGLASGVIGAAGSFGGFLFPAWLGFLKDATGTYGSGFRLFGILSMVAAVSVGVALNRRRMLIQDRQDIGGID